MENKKRYVIPEIEILELQDKDIILSSPTVDTKDYYDWGEDADEILF